MVLLINNRDIIWSRGERARDKAGRSYRCFLLGALAYLVTDLLWGILASCHLTALLYADTAIHFAAMVGAVMLWTQYVVSYLDTGTVFERSLYHAGRAFFALELVFVAVNFVRPILFWFDGSGGYHAGPAVT
ncbi:MAG: hypothetical protein IJT95_00145 [Abditibacteriota bacterium]|nr:hypothetical protein [Abditibacteriota bacterium]